MFGVLYFYVYFGRAMLRVCLSAFGGRAARSHSLHEVKYAARALLSRLLLLY